jgi:hypothetical protein
MIRSLWDDPTCGRERFTVAVDGGAVVSSLCLMTGSLELQGTSIPIGQPEFVASDPAYEHQGLVRRQMELVHQWSAEAGHLTQFIGGIPYFYRLFGYEYAIPMPQVRVLLPGSDVSRPDGWTVRLATDGDVDAIVDLEKSVQQLSDLVGTRRAGNWRWWIAHGGDEGGPQMRTHVALRHNSIEASAGIGKGPHYLGEAAITLSSVAGRHPDGLQALIAHAADSAPGKPVAVMQRAGLASTIESRSTVDSRHYALYVRAADPVALLDHLRPVLSQRLARSPYAATSGELFLSTYVRSLTISYDAGRVTGIEGGGPEQDPLRRGGAGVPPDQLVTLIFGRHGASGLAERHDDVRLGTVQPLMDALFPKITSDVMLDF